MNEKLEDMKRVEKALLDNLSEIRDQIKGEILYLIEQKYGVKEGSIVISKGKKHRVTRVDTEYCHDIERYKPWLEGNPMKKDGTFGKAHRNIYTDWKHSKETK